ncbi:hypothetical protein ACSA002_2010 [Salmonella phage vB_SalM_SA002]|nr:hypothetical protein ACSA002_2010 [Salmonella phage vB_SalM_SA002]
MTVLQLQLNNKRGFVLTTPKQACPNSVKLLEGEFKVENDRFTLGNVELARISDNGVKLNSNVLTNGVGDIRQIVQQLRYYLQVWC